MSAASVGLKDPDPPRHTWSIRPALGWLSVAVVLLGVQYAVTVARGQNTWSTWHGSRSALAGWTQFDGWEYVRIAEEGYRYAPATRAPVVFFPLYPLAIRLAQLVVDDPVVAGFVVSAAAGLVAVTLYRRWLDLVGSTGPAIVVAVGLMLLYPYGWYLYGVVYSDALFLALVLASFLLVERRHLALAGLVGALATVTRPTGVALIPALLVLAAERSGALVPAIGPAATPLDGPVAGERVRRWRVPLRIDRARVRPQLAWPLLAVVGVGSYSAYLWVKWGNPLLWASSQTEYHGSGPTTWFKGGFVLQWIDGESPLYTATITLQAALAGVVLLTAPAVGRRYGWGYAVFVTVLVAIPVIATEDFNGTGRYLLAAFPTMALVGEQLARRRRAAFIVLAACSMVLVGFAIGFSNSRMLT